MSRGNGRSCPYTQVPRYTKNVAPLGTCVNEVLWPAECGARTVLRNLYVSTDIGVTDVLVKWEDSARVQRGWKFSNSPA